MSLRDQINANQNIVVIVAVVVTVVAVTFIVMRGRGPSYEGSGDAWYMDTETGEVFRASATLYPPIKSENDNEAIRVHYYTCTKGDCGEDKRFIAYYDKYTPEAKEKLEAAKEERGEPSEMMEMELMEAEETGRLFSMDGKQWIPQNDPRFDEDLADFLKSKCDPERAYYCRPDK